MDDTVSPGPAIAATRAVLTGDRDALNFIARSISDYDFRESCTALLRSIVDAAEWGRDEVAVIEFGHDIAHDSTISGLNLSRFAPVSLLASFLGRVWAGDLLAALLTEQPEKVIRPYPLYFAPKRMQVQAQALLCANVLYWASETSDDMHELLRNVGELARRDYR